MRAFTVIAAGLCLGVATVAVSAAPAHAALISADDTVFGVGSITRDTDTGLEWLDLTESVGFSFDDASVLFGAGDLFAGWSHANTGEVTQLFTNGGFTPDHSSSPATPEMLALINLLGVTLVQNGISGAATFTRGRFDDGGALNIVGSADLVHSQGVFDSPFGPLPDDTELARVFSSFSSASDPSDNTGNFLVRSTAPIPEPASLTLLGIGLLGLGALRRRQRSSTNAV